MKNLILALSIILTLIACTSKENVEDVVVIGGGLMGSSTAWEISKNGQKVLLIEQQDTVYTFGSSFGEARISRCLGPQGDIFSYLQQISVRETHELIDYLNQDKIEPLHTMEDIYTTSPVTYLYSKSDLNEFKDLLNSEIVEVEYATTKLEAKEKFGMDIPYTTLVIREFKTYSGTLNPKLLIHKLHLGIQKSGSRINYNQQVTRLTKENGVYKINVIDTKTGTTKTIYSKKVIAAAGPYNGTLVEAIAPYFKRLITPKRLFLSFLKIKPEKYDMLTSEEKSRLNSYYPVAYINSELYYSMIEKYDEHNRPVIKVGGHFLRSEIEDLNDVWKMKLTDQEINWSKKYTADYLNKLELPLQLSDLEYERGYSCVYSLTKSEVPYVSYIITNKKEIDSSFVFVGGMSGVGAKGSLAYGLIAADLLLGNENETPMYQKTKSALGSSRLMKDIQNLD